MRVLTNTSIWVTTNHCSLVFLWMQKSPSFSAGEGLNSIPLRRKVEKSPIGAPNWNGHRVSVILAGTQV